MKSRPSATPTPSELDEIRRKRLAEDIIARSGLPRRHLKLRQSDAKGDAWAASCTALTKSLLGGMTGILSGDRGRGKTQMAVCASREFAAKGKTVRYIRAMDLFRDLREGMNNNCESDRIKHFSRPHLLIIDDAHERGDTEYETRSMVNLVDHRYGDEKATLLITNQSRAAFAKSVGPSIVSRIVESGVFIECDWKSYRGSA
ncbi:MAG: ATP-binding protein [Phycisphaerales bacterium JB063]